MSGFVLILRVKKWPKRGISVYLQNVNDDFRLGIGRTGMFGSCPVCPLIPGAGTSADARASNDSSCNPADPCQLHAAILDFINSGISE